MKLITKHPTSDEISIIKTLGSSKILSSIIIFLLTSLVGWGIWTTNNIFKNKAIAEEVEKQVPKIEDILKDIQKEQRNIKKEQKEDLKDILKILIDIQKQINNDN